MDAKAAKAKIVSSVKQNIKSKQASVDQAEVDAKICEEYFSRCKAVLGGMNIWKNLTEDEIFVKALNKNKKRTCIMYYRM